MDILQDFIKIQKGRANTFALPNLMKFYMVCHVSMAVTFESEIMKATEKKVSAGAVHFKIFPYCSVSVGT